MAITLFGQSTRPLVENETTLLDGDSAGPTLTLTPPASMLSGDLVWVSVLSRNSPSPTNSATGGQTWTASTVDTSLANHRARNFWSVFNGTWTADPAFGGGVSGSPMQATMLVFRSNLTTPGFSLDAIEAQAAVSGLVSPFEVTTPSLSPSAGALTIARFTTTNDVTWSVVSSTFGGWSNVPWRNQAGSDCAMAVAYNLLSTTGTQTITEEMTVFTQTSAVSSIVSFVETGTPSGPTPTPAFGRYGVRSPSR